MFLSKSKYTSGIQCPKMLWMRQNMPEQFDDSVMNEAILQQGSAVGDIAMGYYGPFVEVQFDPKDPRRFSEAVQQTKDFLDKGCSIICEATFRINGHYCMVDILRVRDDGSFDLVEVKSSTEVKPIYLHDMSYQCWVIQQCGYKVRSASLMHVNSEYVRQGELDIHQLFTVEDCTDEVLSMLAEVPLHVERILAIADSKEEPFTPIGEHCYKPYACGFRKWCFRELPPNNVLGLSRIRKDKAFNLIGCGLAGFDELVGNPKVFSTLTAKQQQQVLSVVNDLPVSIEKDGVRGFLNGLWYPLHFLDFETFQEAVPSFDSQRPYEQVTSQYSLHWIDEPGGELHHTEFLGDAGSDPRRQVAEHLCEDIPADACVLAWNMSFEKGRISDMASLFPDLAERLLAIRDNARDLMTPFARGHYYMKEMEGSASIKKVLPALFPNDAELDYHALDGVHNGGEAAFAFQHLAELPPQEQEITREQLLRYCELDTLAMVRIWEKLVKTVTL